MTTLEELQARVFEPFFTTKGVGAGTRPGLDIGYRIVAGRHSCDLRVASRPGDMRFQVRPPMNPPGGRVRPPMRGRAVGVSPGGNGR